MMIAEGNKDRIKEFFELRSANQNLRQYHRPVLVYEVVGDKVRFSLWEEDILNRYGLKNVDGWDETEDLFYCPDWMQGKEEEEEDIDLDDEDDL